MEKTTDLLQHLISNSDTLAGRAGFRERTTREFAG